VKEKGKWFHTKGGEVQTGCNEEVCDSQGSEALRGLPREGGGVPADSPGQWMGSEH